LREKNYRTAVENEKEDDYPAEEESPSSPFPDLCQDENNNLDAKNASNTPEEKSKEMIVLIFKQSASFTHTSLYL
jgi:hypothetical protein